MLTLLLRRQLQFLVEIVVVPKAEVKLHLGETLKCPYFKKILITLLIL